MSPCCTVMLDGRWLSNSGCVREEAWHRMQTRRDTAPVLAAMAPVSDW